MLQMGRGPEGEIQKHNGEYIFPYLKKFQARSKVVFWITDPYFEITNVKKVKNGLNPFLKHKIIFLKTEGEKVEIEDCIRWEFENCIKEV